MQYGMNRGSIKKFLSWAIVIGTIMMGGVLYPESVDEIDRRATDYYNNKEFSKALGEWLGILEIDPENESAQKKIEMLYEEKHRKDVSFQTAKYLYRDSLDSIAKGDIEKAKDNSDRAIASFVTAYRIDPKDAELQIMKEDMRKLQEEVQIELAKKRLSEGLKKRYLALMKEADANIKSQQFETAVKNYKEVLSFVPNDIAAMEGLRNAELAISNRLKYERIQSLLVAGIALFDGKKYKEARGDFNEVLGLDAKNREAKDYIRKIDDILEESRNYEMKRLQAEQFYLSGIENIKNKNFDQAVDDFENVLALIKNYKDTVERLNSIDRLRREYLEELKLLKLKNIDREFQNGLIAYADARYKEALSYFERTIVLDPANDLAKKYIQRVKDALKDIEEEVVDNDSPYYDVVNSLAVSGRQLYDKGDYIGSRQRWEKILRLFPKNRLAQEFLLKCEFRINPEAFSQFATKIVDEGQNFLREKKYERALRQFELIQTIVPTYPGIGALIAAAKNGMEKKAEPPGASPQEIEARYAKAMDLYRRGGRENTEQALKNFRWIMAKDPNNVKALINVNRIESQLRLGGVEATEKRGALTEKQKQLVRTYYYNGINYYTNNNFDRAIEEWRKVLAIDPEHEKARNNIRKCLVLLGR